MQAERTLPCHNTLACRCATYGKCIPNSSANSMENFLTVTLICLPPNRGKIFYGFVHVNMRSFPMTFGIKTFNVCGVTYRQSK